MMELSSFVHGPTPGWTFPRVYNAAHDLIERNLKAGRGGKTAYIDDAGRYSYDDLAKRVNRAANLLTRLGIPPESRVMLCLLDTIDYPALFLGAIKAGLVPIATNTLLTSRDYEFILGDSQARALIVAEPLLPQFQPFLAKLPALGHVVVAGSGAHGHKRLAGLMAGP